MSTYEALCRHLVPRGPVAYDREAGRWHRRPATLWPYANLWSATCALAELEPGGGRYRSDLARRLDGLVAYRAGARRANWSGDELLRQVRAHPGPIAFASRPSMARRRAPDVFFDDNGWIALAVVHQHRITGDDRLVALAVALRDGIAHGWVTGDRWAHPGGVRWAVPAWSTTRNTCATAPASELGTLLYGLTGDEAHLQWARRCHAWVVETLERPDGLYGDRIEQDGTVRNEAWSYNQGAMIGAGVLLFEATGERRFLERARATASAANAWMRAGGVIADQGPPLFAIYLRNVLLLGRHDRAAVEYRDALELARAYGERAWDAPGHRRDGLFARHGAVLNPTAGMVAIFAMMGAL